MYIYMYINVYNNVYSVLFEFSGYNVSKWT